MDKKGRPVLGPAQEQASHDKPVSQDPVDDQEDNDDHVDLFEKLGIRAMSDAGEDAEGEVDEAEREKEQCAMDAQGLSKELECQVPGLKWKELHFIEILKRKTSHP